MKIPRVDSGMDRRRFLAATATGVLAAAVPGAASANSPHRSPKNLLEAS